MSLPTASVPVRRMALWRPSAAPAARYLPRSTYHLGITVWSQADGPVVPVADIMVVGQTLMESQIWMTFDGEAVLAHGPAFSAGLADSAPPGVASGASDRQARAQAAGLQPAVDAAASALLV